MQHCKLQEQWVGDEKGLSTRRMRYTLELYFFWSDPFVDCLIVAILALYHGIMNRILDENGVQVFLDIVESVNLLMSQKGEFESASEWTSLDALWRTTFDLKTVTWQIKCLLHHLSSHICNDGHLHFLCFQPVMTCPSEMCQFNQLRVLGIHLMKNLFYPCFRHHFAMRCDWKDFDEMFSFWDA
jgi:hypothetical protein